MAEAALSFPWHLFEVVDHDDLHGLFAPVPL